VLGVLSLIIWSLILIICVKYLIFILRADNRGEGGVLALLSLAIHNLGERSRKRAMLMAVGVFGAALLYGDGMITPAISVVSAVEGLREPLHIGQGPVVAITLGILVGLFSVQSLGTERVGWMFGPITFVWFIVIAILGMISLVKTPAVLAAFSPLPAFEFLFTGGWSAFIVLGSVFLAVTGGEALYADMGHFGKGPIRIGWFSIVLPALLLNYLGQGALILREPGAVTNPFFKLAPAWFVYPLVGLATAATVIASQALITGMFSLTLQAIQLGYLPRAAIKHTSEHTRGQIYIPVVNWVLMIACLGLVAGFGSSSRLAAAYGVSVTLTMLITTVLFYFVTRERWRWNFFQSMGLCAGFVVIEGAFFGANAVKIPDGGWFPLAVALGIFTLMTTWKTGRRLVAQNLSASALPQEDFIASLRRRPPQRVPGTAVFMTSNAGRTPSALLHNLKHNKILHERVIFLTITTEDVPYVPPSKQVEIEELEDGFLRLSARYGYMQEKDVPQLLRRAKSRGLEVTAEEATFFLGRETIVPGPRRGMARWREHLFAFMAKIGQQPASFFRLPPGRVVELGMQVEL
jgi:KUP system potassium uptake protein